MNKNVSVFHLVVFINSNFSLDYRTLSTPIPHKHQTQLWCFANNPITKTGHILYFAILPEIQNHFPRLLRCCMWLYLKERSICTLPAPQTVWQPKQLLLKPGLWTQSAACLSLWHWTYYGSLCLPPCTVGAVVWLVKQADRVTALITAGENFNSAVPTQPRYTKIS